MFAYEIFISNIRKTSDVRLNNSYVVVYNFHNLFTNSRLFVFTKTFSQSDRYEGVGTVSELFSNSSWLEREVAELHGVQFSFKKDLRNLMLQYGDTSNPFRKSFPSIGFRETTYDVISDSVIQNRIDTQN